MAIIEDSEQFRKPRPMTLKSDLTSKIGRCSVCARRRTGDYENRQPLPPRRVVLPDPSELIRPNQPDQRFGFRTPSQPSQPRQQPPQYPPQYPPIQTSPSRIPNQGLRQRPRTRGRARTRRPPPAYGPYAYRQPTPRAQ